MYILFLSNQKHKEDSLLLRVATVWQDKLHQSREDKIKLQLPK